MLMDFPVRILIVDDQPLVLAGLSAILEAQGFTCRTALSGIEALRLLRQSLPDIIVSDLSMPGMSGFELFSIVRRRFPLIGLVAISGDFIVKIEDSSHLMNAFFQKGQHSPEELVETIRQVHQASVLARNSRTAQMPFRLFEEKDRGLLLSCHECLRAFHLDDLDVADFDSNTAVCPLCSASVPYVLDGAMLLVAQ